MRTIFKHRGMMGYRLDDGMLFLDHDEIDLIVTPHADGSVFCSASPRDFSIAHRIFEVPAFIASGRTQPEILDLALLIAKEKMKAVDAQIARLLEVVLAQPLDEESAHA